MTTQIALYATLGLTALLVMAMIAVAVARNLDGSRTEAKAMRLAQVSAAFSSFKLGPPGLRKALGFETPENKEEAGDASGQKKNSKGWTSLAASIGIVAAVIGGVVGFVKDHEPIKLETTELATGDGLHGVMLSPTRDAPVVLIIPGSGPTDRDGNSPAGLRTDAYRLLADKLAQERIATVRIDKRGLFSSAAAGDPSAVNPQIYANDIRSWIDIVRQTRHADCVFLLGHSEGALMASLAAAGRKDVCGLILVAGPGRKMGDLIREQLKANPANAPVLDEALAALGELESGRPVDTAHMNPALVPLFAPPVQPYLMSVMQIDPVDALRHAGRRTLIVQGDNDLQVSLDDARLLDKAPRTRLRIIHGMNHVLKDAPADRAGNLATYAAPDLPLAHDLVRRIEQFVKDED